MKKVEINNKSPRVLADSWYALPLSNLSVSVDDLIKKKCPQWLQILGQNAGIVRGLLIFFLSQDYDLVAAAIQPKGMHVFFLLEACFNKGKKRIIWLECLRSNKPKSRLKRIFFPFLLCAIYKPIMKRTLKYVHVLTAWEREHYALMYDLPKEVFVYIPWPKRRADDLYPQHIETGCPANLKIVSSGRNACDWETLFKAAQGQNWDLTVICSRRDLKKVQRLNRISANVLCDIPVDQHEKKLKESDIYVLCLIEEDHSCGHIRINNATRFGLPIVATGVRGIDGYIIHGETGILTPPGDYMALRDSINSLLGDPELRKLLVKNAFERAINQTREKYLDNINQLIKLAMEGVRKDKQWLSKN